MTGPTLRIALEEGRWLWRHGLPRVAGLAMLALMLAATVAAWSLAGNAEVARERAQAAADQSFLDQPERHPHRVVHYGQFALRPLGPLAFFDFGIEPYTGQLIYLEGHRQNSANFADARQSSLLLRFGVLSPAFVLQLLAPLLILLLAHAAIARERERGSLRLLQAQGIDLGRLVAGKLLAHATLVPLLALPAFLALAFSGVANGAIGTAALAALLYLLYLLAWVVIALLCSLLAPRPREALLAGLGLWALLCVALPRLGADAAALAEPVPSRVATDIGVEKALAAIGDSHDPDDPYFGAFRERMLREYGADRIEDLPVNYNGLVMLEGERLTSELFQAQVLDLRRRTQAQARHVLRLGWASPLLALRPASMHLAGSDIRTHEAFLDQAEAHRFAFVQALNTLHAEQIQREDDRAQRLGRDTWAELPRFRFEPPPTHWTGPVTRALTVLALWLAGGLALLAVLARRPGRAA